MKLLTYVKTLKELELYIEAGSILSKPVELSPKMPEELWTEGSVIPMEEMAKLDKFRILKELEDEEDSIVL